MQKIVVAIKTVPRIVTPETWKHLEKIAQRVEDPGLSKTIAAMQKKGKSLPKVEFGFLWFPVYSSTRGHVLGLRVRDRESDDVSKDRLKLLDEIGSAVYSALRSRLPLHGFLPWWPDRFSFQIVNVFGEERTNVDGRSLALPLALALYSHAFQAPIPAHLSASANVRRNGAIEGVESINEKLHAIHRERPFVTEVLVAGEQKDIPFLTALTVKKFNHVEEVLRYVFGSSFPPDLTRFTEPIDVQNEAHAIQRLYKDHLYDTCIENATAIIGYLEQAMCPLPRDASIRALFTAYWRRGSCQCHRGDVDHSLADFTKAQDLSGRHKGIVRPDEYLSSQISVAVMLKDMFRYRDAEVLHRRVALDLQKGLGTDKERVKNEGSWSQLCLAMDRFNDAETKQRQAISLNHGGDIYRNYNYLGQIYTRWGFFRKAKAALDKANQLLSSSNCLNQSEIENDRFYLNLYRAEYLYRYGSTLKRKKGILEELLGIRGAIAKVGTWVRPLTWKWIALGLLWEEETVDRGLVLLEEACAFYADKSDPVLKLLEVTTRAERSLHFLGVTAKALQPTSIAQTLRTDLTMIDACLGLSPDIGKHFQKERSTFKKHREAVNLDHKHIRNALLSLCRKIPY